MGCVMSDNHSTQQALSDLQIMRQAMMRPRNRAPLSVDSIDTHLMLNVGALAFTLGLGIWELSGELTNDMLLTAHMAPELRLSALGLVGAVLGVLLAAAYAFIRIKSKERHISFNDYSERYFTYFKNISAVSDVVVKFIVTAMLIMAGRPELVAPVFVLFIGDLVMQGRLHIMMPKAAGAVGGACVVASVGMAVAGVTSIMWPIAAFSAACVISIVHILRYRRQMTKAEGEG